MVVEFVQNGRELDSQLTDTGSGHEAAFIFVARTREDHIVPNIALHLPDIAGVGFQDVNGQERYPVLVMDVQIVEGGNLPPERWSGVTAED